MRRARTAAAAILACGAALVLSCSARSAEPASIWTDAPALALAVELFNGSQDRYRVQVRWDEDIARALRASKRPPALVAGRYLRGPAIRDKLVPLDYLFKRSRVNRESFYGNILELGEADGGQFLIPLSFNLPAMVFARGGAPAGDEFTVSLAGMEAASSAVDARTGGSQGAVSNARAKSGSASPRMSFSPRWDADFLVLAVDSGGAAFRQGKNGLAWEEAGLARAIDEIRGWIARVDGSAAAADDYQFKYLYAPAYQYLREGRARFAYMKSSEAFLVPEDKRESLDFRWFSSGGIVPVCDDVIYVAMPRKGSGRPAAEAFVEWLFQEESQAAMLELSKRTRAMESNFGIAGGFSSMRDVNERDFSGYYPSLIGHMPPAGAMAASAALPEDWPTIKSDVLAPWLLEATASDMPSSDADIELAAKFAEYRKKGTRGR